MKAIRPLVGLTALILAVSVCLGMISVGKIPKEQAKDWGVALKATANGPKEAWLELKFKPEGKLADFDHVSLEISDAGEFQLGWTPLKDERTSDGYVVVRLMGNREFLNKVTLEIVCSTATPSGHDVCVKDFVDLKELH